MRIRHFANADLDLSIRQAVRYDVSMAAHAVAVTAIEEKEMQTMERKTGSASAMAPFAPRNNWYVAAFSSEVSRNLIERWLLEDLVVLYRTEAGVAIAIEGRCAHRHFPLVGGKLVGDNVECSYHGFTYAPDGTCVRVPVSPRPPKNCRIKSYPLVERGSWIWIWMGESEDADVTLIPDLEAHGLNAPGFVNSDVFYKEINCRYELLHDNLLDLSHLSFLHYNTIGGGNDAAAVTPEKHTEGEGWVQSERSISSVPIPRPFVGPMNYDGLVDRTVPIRFFVPSVHIAGDFYAEPANEDGTPGKPIAKLQIFHALTPGHRNTVHYFVVLARNFALDAPIDELLRPASLAVIQEDIAGVEAIELVIAEYGDKLPGEFHARSDTHQLHARRKLQQMIQAELSSDRIEEKRLSPGQPHDAGGELNVDVVT